MTDETVSQCRAALLKVCRTRMRGANDWIDADDAAACMAEREARLRDALDRIAFLSAQRGYSNPEHTLAEINAALAAAREAP